MARTSPAPNIPPIPGMCPGVAVLAGNGDGGGGSGKGGKNGKGKKGAGTDDDDEDASGDGANGGDGQGDPICPVSGRVFLDVYDFGSPGPLPLRLIRSYSSRLLLSGDFGVGWTHALAWSIAVSRRRVIVIDEGGREQTFERPKSAEPVTNAFGWRLSRTDEDGFVLYTPDGQFREFAVSGKRGWLTSLGDRNGNRIRIERDQKGRLQRIIDSAGRPFHVSVDASGRVVAIAVPEDAKHTSAIEVGRYAYDRDGRLVAFTDAEGFVWRYAYDGNLLTEHITPTGLTYHYRYDARLSDAWCVESWGDYGDQPDPALDVWPPAQPESLAGRPVVKGINYVHFTYLKADHYTEMVDGLGGVTRFFGDARNRLVKKVDSAGGVTEYAYDERTGDRIYETMPNGEQRNARAAPTGGVDRIVTPEGVIHKFDHEELQWWFDEARGTLVRRKLDPAGNLRMVLHPDHTIEEYERDARGLVTQAVSRDGGITYFTYDDMGNLVRRERRGLPAETFHYDYLGRCVECVYADGKRWAFAWDRRNEISAVRMPNGGLIHVERDGLRKPTRVDRCGRIWTFVYGGVGWLTQTVDPGGRSFTTKYDVEGNIVRAVNGRGQTLRQWFDSAKRCIEVETWEGVRLTAGYDLMSNPIWVDRPQGREQRVFDQDNNLIGAETPEGAIAIEIDPIKFSVVVDTGTERTETYTDRIHQPLREVQGPHEVRIGWIGAHPTIVASDVGVAVGYTRTAAGWVDRVVAGKAINVRKNIPGTAGWYDQLGELVIEREYAADGQLARRTLRLANDAGTRLDEVRYEYDTGHMLRRESHANGRLVEYDLNGADQVVVRRIIEGSIPREERWNYDAAGTALVPGARYDSQMRPVEIGNETRVYDETGQLIERVTDTGVVRYEWSSTGELLRVVDGEKRVELGYDGRGRRVAKKVFVDEQLRKHTRYVWANNLVLHEVDELSGATRTYVREENHWEPFAHVDRSADGTETAYYYLTDQVGAVDRVVDAQGKVVWDAERTLFGDYTETTRSIDVSVRLLNQHWDEDVGFAYNYRRWYDPRTAQFLSPDPRLVEGWITPRDYVPNPTRFVDPTGLIPGVGGAGIPGMPAGFGAPGTSTSTLVPGPNAQGAGAMFTPPGGGAPISVPGFVEATGPFAGAANTRNFPADLRRGVDAAGYAHGCHGCGSQNPGTSSGHFIPDHQPPISQQNSAPGGFTGTVRLYPHCLTCARQQGGQQSAASQHNSTNSGLAGQAQGAFNSANPSPPPSSAAIQNTTASLVAAGVMPAHLL